MSNLNINFINRIALVILATVSIALAAGCATEPTDNSNSNAPSSASAPATASTPANATTPATSASPAANSATPADKAAPAVSPSPKEKKPETKAPTKS